MNADAATQMTSIAMTVPNNQAEPRLTEGPEARVSFRAQPVLPDKPAEDYEYEDYYDDCAEQSISCSFLYS